MRWAPRPAAIERRFENARTAPTVSELNMQRVCDQRENQCTCGQGRLASTASERSGSLSTNFCLEVSCCRHRQHFLTGVGIFNLCTGVSIVAVVGDLIAAHQSCDGYRLAVRARHRLSRARKGRANCQKRAVSSAPRRAWIGSKATLSLRGTWETTVDQLGQTAVEAEALTFPAEL